MNREIKFRAWDRQDKVMTISRDFNSWLDAFAQAEYDSMTNFNHRASQFIWLQYTGLKDKNGREIYEGDIIQNVADDGTKLSSFEIKWIDEQCRFVKWKLENVDDGARYYELSLSKFYVVIGNIYEKEQPTAIVSDLINYSDSLDKIK